MEAIGLPSMTSLTNKGTIERLYAAFAERDGVAMAACYAPGAHFRDPAFGDLEGDDIGAMWRMLTGRARDLEITLREHEADERTGTAHWFARYTFSTGRRVENDIHARFSFDGDAQITDHVDDFDFRRWASQALGPKGHLVALLPPMRAKARAQALAQLTAFEHGETGSAP
jgi:ketosteroid isomerase-like protein